MRNTKFLIAALLGAAAAPIGAQTAATGLETPNALSITPYAGYMVYGNLMTGPIGTRVGTAPAPLYGAQLGIALVPGISLVGNVAYSRSNLEVGVPILGGYPIAPSSALLYDGGLQLDVPMPSTTSMSLTPFVQAGVGGLRYHLSSSLIDLSSNGLAGNVGVGADLHLGTGIALRVMAKDYVGKIDVGQSLGLDLQSSTTHNWGLTGGLRLSF